MRPRLKSASRPGAGTGVLDIGVDLVTVAMLLGHDSVKTAEINTQPSARDVERAVEQLETT